MTDASSTVPSPEPNANIRAEFGTPLSYTQESLWLLDKLAVHREPAYNESLAFSLHGDLNQDALVEALRLVVLRHETLRTTFAETPEGLRAFVHHNPGDFVQVLDLRGFALHEARVGAQKLIDGAYRQPFDLAAGPLLRAVIVLLSDKESIFGLTVHHIAVDGWSLSVMLGEIQKHYLSLSQTGQPAMLPALTTTFAAYADRLRRAMEAGAFENSLEQWKRTLDGAPKLLQLPLDRPRPPMQSFVGASRSIFVPRARLAPLLERAQRESGATEFTVWLAAYAALLHRYSGQNRMTIGTTLLNRPDVDLLGVVGCFVNTAALTLKVEDTTTFRHLLEQATAVSREMLQRQEAPYPKVLERLDIERDASYSPVFQTMLTSLGKKKNLNLGPTIGVRPFSVTRAAAKFDLLIYVSESDGDFEFEAEFNTDVLESATAERILGHYVYLLTHLAENFDHDVSRLALLPPEERHLILSTWNDTRVEYPNATVVDQIEAQAAQTPQVVAVECGNETLTYGELHELTNRIAHTLQARSDLASGFVGVYMERSIDMAVALLSIVKAGLAYVPIDPEYPAERIRYMIEDAQVPLILTQEKYRAALAESGAAAVVLKDVSGQDRKENIQRTLRPDSRAYMIYTSGSTGRPKGVINHHTGLFNRLQWMQSQYPLTTEDRVLQKTPFSFDVSVWEFFWPLMFGARIVMAEPGGHRDPEYLKRVIQEKGVTTLHFVPSMLNVFLEEDELAARCTSVRQVFCSGEALPYSTVEAFYAQLSAQLHNLYGPTEAAIDVSYWPCTTDYPGRVVPIGKPVANTTLVVVDKHLQLQPVGVPGELCIGGVQLAEGYHNRPDLTQNAFVSNPFTELPGTRLYRTGDLARFLPDGNIEYLGRIDNQVKLRGFRIELGEIEAVVQGLPFIKDAAVLVHEHGSHRMLVAYIVADEFDQHEARRLIKMQLPDFMVPQVFVELPTLPTTANGKLDRKALPDPLKEAISMSVPRPLSATEERQVAKIWREVLGVEEVSADSHFIRLGGDSIHSVRIAARLRELGYFVEVQDVFSHPTVRELARHLSSKRSQTSPAHVREPFALVSAEDRRALPHGVEDAWPLTTLQAGMLYHSMLHEGSSVYHDIFSYDFEGPADRQRLGEAVQAILVQRPQLRSSFDLSSFNEPLQLIHATVDAPLIWTDVSTLPTQEQDAAVARWVDTEKRRAFDLEQSPLIRFQVHARSAERFTFTVAFHHVILDGWSVALIMEDLRRAYQHLLGGRSIILEPERVPFSTYVTLEQAALQAPSQREFWQECLSGWLPTTLTSHHTPRGRGTSRPATRERIVKPELSSKLTAIARECDLPLKSALLALHLHVLGSLTGQERVVSGLVVNGRPEVGGAEHLAGLFLNTLPFPAELRQEEWPTFFSRVFQLEQASLPHRRFPLAEILKRTEREAWFDTVFNYTDFHVYAEEEDYAVRIASARYFEHTNFNVIVHAHRDHFTGDLKLAVNYDANQLSEDLIERYLDAYLAAASEAVRGQIRRDQTDSDQCPPTETLRSCGDVTSLPVDGERSKTLELQVSEVFAQALGLAQVGADDRYLELGVDSITAIRIVARLKRLGVKVALPDVFSHNTVRELATHATWTVSSSTEAGHQPFALANQSPDTFPAGIKDAYPATAVQLLMIRAHDEDVEQAVYHDLFTYHLNLPFSRAALATSLQHLVDRHEVLRTGFALGAQPVPLQLVFGAVTPHLEVTDLSDLPPHEQDASLRRWSEAEKSRGFDWTRPHLMRFYVHKRGPSLFSLTLSFHHSVIDGWSLSLFIRDLIGHYVSVLTGRPLPALTPPILSYRDYVAVESASRDDLQFREFWQRELKDCTAPTLPRTRSDVDDARWSETKVVLTHSKQAALTELAQQVGVPLKHVMLTAHTAVISLLCGAPEVLTAVFASGRLEEEGGDEAIGLFLNFVPLRQSLEGQSWESLIAQTFATDRRTLPYRRYPLSDLQRDSVQPLALDTAFNYTQFKAYSDVAFQGEPGKDRPLEVLSHIDWFEHTHFTLLANVGFDLHRQQLIITLNADGRVLPQRFVDTLGVLYDAVLSQMIAAKDGPLTPSSEVSQLITQLRGAQS